MQAIVIKYIQLFCVAVFFDNVSCDQIMLKNYKDDLLFYQTTSCTASCLKKYTNKTLKECYERYCEYQRFNDTGPKERNSTNFRIKLLCRDNSSLIVKFVDDYGNDVYDSTRDLRASNNVGMPSNYKYSMENQGKGNLYTVKVEHTGNVLSNKIVYIAESPLVQIKNLTSNTTYKITATVMHANNQYTNAAKSISLATLAEGYQPGAITKIHLSDFKLSATSNKTGDVLITWEPSHDRTCRYVIYQYDSKEDSGKLDPLIINQPELLYQHTLRNLSFDSAYNVGIGAVNTKSYEQSDITWINFTTPTCWDWYKNDTNLEMCPPFTPTNIVVEPSFKSKNLYQMNVYWDKPERQPYNYSLIISDYFNSSIQLQVPGENTHQFIDNVEIVDHEYEVQLRAFSPGGMSINVETFSLRDILAERIDTMTIILYVGGSIFAMILVAILIVTFMHLRARSRRRQNRDEYFEGLDKQRPTEIKNEDKRTLLEEEIKKTFFNDGMEIDEDDIEVLDIIGEGAFGFVRRGILLPTGKEVAVKMLKDVVTFDVMHNFCQEVEVMRSVDKHPNIVGIVGHCMRDIERMMLLTEYCSEGNLLDFLRNYWQRLMKCPASKAPVSNGLINDQDFRKPSENEFNFGSSIPEKNLIKQKNIHNLNNDSLPEFRIKNLIINKLYDECSDNKNVDAKRFHTHECSNSCKSYVDIIEEGFNDKTRISVKDCDCKENEKNKILNHLDEPISIVENRGYESESKIKQLAKNPSERTMTKRDLLTFALQIATGMEFLSFNKVVHRDLAARNVCVCSDLTVKIADFGLSRDIYQENVYKKSSEGKLPIKWLALESMTFQMYTSQSDVWSYGILLYEIVTLGSIPYPSIQTTNLLKLLMSGYRMEKPSNCDDNIYQLMLSCWKTVPSERPTFTEIKVKLERLLKEFKDDQPIHDKMFEENLRSIASSELYLKPL